ncbi:MAG: FecR domain-containing protein [Proteobacteria bacterium]|nr:FecR domain-containing protein [Pseudomonadota bacterium]
MQKERELSRVATEQAAEAWETFNGTEEASASEHREFGEWMRRSPEHVEAYLRIARTMNTLHSQNVRWPDTSAEVLVREAREYTDRRVTSLREESQAEPRSSPQRSARVALTFAFAASILAAIAAAWFVLMSPQTFETRFGEQRFVRLDDGSGVTLNTASKIEVNFGKDHRVVHLTKGEALFDVSHDTARPFDVHSGKTVLRALGTRFDVDVRPARTTITVLEGVVSLAQDTNEASSQVAATPLHASDRVVIDSSGPGTVEHGVRLDEVTAWTQQKLVFKGRPLGEVAEEFNRYNRERIVIESPALRSQEITGVFKANDPASFLAFLSNLPGVKVRDDGKLGHIVTLDEATGSRP